MTKFNNTYRIESARLKHWDYAQKGVYFITICTANRTHFFGTVENQVFIPSEIGTIVEQEWIKTPNIRPDMNLELGEFAVMPNHFHGIIFIGNNAFNRRDTMHGVSKTNDNSKIISNTIHDDTIDTFDRDAMHGVSTDTGEINNEYKNEFGPQSKNVSSIIRGFKSAVTVQAKKINPDFGWQPRFYDHIIRNQQSYDVISQYIIDNPKKWVDDKFNK